MASKKLVVRLKDLSIQAGAACVKLSKGMDVPKWEVKALRSECKRLVKAGKAIVVEVSV